MNIVKTVELIAVMAIVTYLIRMIPFAFFRKKIKSQFLRSFFFYLPFAVLSAMTFPFIFYSTSSLLSATIGTIIALILAVCKRQLIVVAIVACLAVVLCNYAVLLWF